MGPLMEAKRHTVEGATDLCKGQENSVCISLGRRTNSMAVAVHGDMPSTRRRDQNTVQTACGASLLDKLSPTWWPSKRRCTCGMCLVSWTTIAVRHETDPDDLRGPVEAVELCIRKVITRARCPTPVGLFLSNKNKTADEFVQTRATQRRRSKAKPITGDIINTANGSSRQGAKTRPCPCSCLCHACDMYSAQSHAVSQPPKSPHQPRCMGPRCGLIGD